MFGSTALEVAIGLALLFAILSLIASSAREFIEALLQTRAVHLERGIRELLKDKDGREVTQRIYDHPLISNLYRGTYNPAQQLTNTLWRAKDPWRRVKFRSNLPAYIPARNFATALLDIAGRGTPSAYDGIDPPLTFEGLKDGIARIENTQLRRALLIAIEDAHGNLETARANIEKWFDSSMDRVSGWYRKQTQWILLGLGLLFAVLLNVDALRIASALYHNDALRSAAVEQAETLARDPQGGEARDAASLAVIGCDPVSDNANAQQAQAAINCARARISDIGYPMGWTTAEKFGWSSIPGWLLTALALSLGAPFWFDLLNKMMVIRSTVKPHEKSPEEASEDRQRRSAAQALPGRNTAADPPPASPTTPSAGPDGSATKPGPARDTPDEPFEAHEWKKGDPQEGEL